MTEPVERVSGALPRGRSLDDRAWSRRHRLLLGLLALHLPFLVVVGLANGFATSHLLGEVSPLVAALALGLMPGRRGIRSAAVTVGLMFSVSLLVHVTGGLVEAHFYYFVLLGFVVLYQDWRPYLLAAGYVVVGQGLLGVLAPGVVYAHAATPPDPWRWALVDIGFVLAACVTHVIFWRVAERQQDQARRYYRQLYEGERAMSEQLRQAQTLKDELFAVVGHEFRTPLTAIQGYARLLDARLDAMDRAGARRSAEAIEREAKRLGRVIANLLAAAEAPAPQPGAWTDLAELSVDVVSDVLELAPSAGRDLRVHLPVGHRVAMGHGPAYQLLFNLLDNAVKFADPETGIRLASRREGDEIVVEVTNVGPAIAADDRERIFQAFVQCDSSDTRRFGGIGVGLHIVRKVVAAHGGRIEATCEGPVVVMRACLPAARAPRVVALPELTEAV